ncbi:hypothetical protein ATO49_01635 [Mycolicibacterium fortuitum subsp. fortuitum DSM 46621 = ATCC 6841 = JCM 6387]|nr:hypothetical protein ATO49_01635 [Mycolicibacterium fortuitum subsp. fortuitum DSM 46621 = ATCC 6841 = JCM 6387]
MRTVAPILARPEPEPEPMPPRNNALVKSHPRMEFDNGTSVVAPAGATPTPLSTSPPAATTVTTLRMRQPIAASRLLDVSVRHYWHRTHAEKRKFAQNA